MKLVDPLLLVLIINFEFPISLVVLSQDYLDLIQIPLNLAQEAGVK